MAYDARRVIVSGAAGVLLAALIIVATTMTSTFFPLPQPETGTLLIKITDAPADLKHLYITIDSFEVKAVDGGWVHVKIPGGRVSFDLLQLSNSSIDAAVDELKTGKYRMIRMHIVQGLAYTNATLKNNQVIRVNVPSEKIMFVTPTFEIKAGEKTILLLDLQVNTVHLASNPQHTLAPAMRIDVTVIYA